MSTVFVFFFCFLYKNSHSDKGYYADEKLYDAGENEHRRGRIIGRVAHDRHGYGKLEHTENTAEDVAFERYPGRAHIKARNIKGDDPQKPGEQNKKKVVRGAHGFDDAELRVFLVELFDLPRAELLPNDIRDRRHDRAAADREKKRRGQLKHNAQRGEQYAAVNHNAQTFQREQPHHDESRRELIFRRELNDLFNGNIL